MKNRSSVLFVFTIFLLLLMSAAGFYSIYVTSSISSDAMIINKLGIVRGSMQRIVKLELDNQKPDAIIANVDKTIEEFRAEKIKMFDNKNQVMDSIDSVMLSWEKLKNSIYEYRKSGNEENRLQLMQNSEEAWYKANDMVFDSQNLAEQKLERYKISFAVLFLNIGLSLVIIFLIKRYVRDTLEGMVNFDSLTGIYNRRYFNEAMHNEIIRSERYRAAFCMIMFDIDHFKKINDTYGHDMGDIILRELAAIVQQCVRKSDTLARVGGEEFAVIVPEAKLENALLLAEKIRVKIQENVFADGIKVTVSLGLTQYKEKDNENSIYKRADNALYKAKANGRNRIEVEEPAGSKAV